MVHRCTNLYRFCTRRPCWLIPTRQLKSLLVAVLPFWESVNGLTFWHGRYCPCSFAATRWPDGCRKLRQRRFQKMYKVSCSSACRWRLSGKSICNVRGRPLLWPLTRLMHLVFGICAATANTDHVRRLGRLCVDHQAMAQKTNSEQLSLRRRFSAHSGQLEAIAGVLGLEWFLRKADNHSRQLLFLFDARAVMGAFAKGRSSAPSLFRAVQKAAALQLVGDLVVRWVYIASESNLADAPFRGLHKGNVSHRKPMSPHVNQTMTEPRSVPDW